MLCVAGLFFVVLQIRSMFFRDEVTINIGKAKATIHSKLGVLLLGCDRHPSRIPTYSIEHFSYRDIPDWWRLNSSGTEGALGSDIPHLDIHLLGFRCACIPFGKFSQYWFQMPYWFFASLCFALPFERLYLTIRQRRRKGFEVD